MLEDQQMGSQTLEILRQGVWASLTGGWFYDPHQDVFCNTFHLYIWLFLLCLPFTIYVYFPPSWYIWYFYCGSVTIGLVILKLVNYALHHMYDTTECIEEEVEEQWQGQRKEDEGIELQILPNKSEGQSSHQGMRAISSFPNKSEGQSSHQGMRAMACFAHDYESEYWHCPYEESLGSSECLQYQMDQAEGVQKPSSTIDLKAEVHRKNSSESSEDLASAPIVEVITHMDPCEPRRLKRSSDRHPKHHQRSKTDGFVTFSINEKKERPMRHRPSLHSVEGPNSNFGAETGRRHSNFTSMGFLPATAAVQVDIKPTGSLELGYIDKNPHQPLTSDNFYFQPTPHPSITGVRRIRSTVLATCCPPPPLAAHPTSLEGIGGGKGALPPPSASLTRNRHLKLCPYYGSEIVYAIAEQSDEHQTSHGPDTDLESIVHGSDSEFEENRQGSHSPLLYTKPNKRKPAPHPAVVDPKDNRGGPPPDGAAATAHRDRPPDEDNSNSSATPDMQDARGEVDSTDDDVSERNLSLRSSTSAEGGEERGAAGGEGGGRRHEHAGNECGAMLLRKRNMKKSKRKGKGAEGKKDTECRRQGNFSSLVELDLDWLFEDEGHRLQHRKEPLKRDTEWSSATTVSLEHDVSKVLQETVPAAPRSLGAIPKKSRAPLTEQPSTSGVKRPPKSESDKCSVCRTKTRKTGVSQKENKVTQTVATARQSDGLECVLYSHPTTSLARMGANKRGCNGGKQERCPPRTEEASSSGSNNELSSLLPPAPLLSAFLNNRREYPLALVSSMADSQEMFRTERQPSSRSRLKRTTRVNRRRSVQMARKETAIATSLSAGYGTHGAKNFNDTSDGSVHCFLDEQGNWITYTFDEKGVGAANADPVGGAVPTSGVAVDKPAASRRPTDASRHAARLPAIDLWDSNSTDSMCNSSMSTILDAASAPKANARPPHVAPGFQQAKFKFIQSETVPKKTRSYYRFRVTPWTHLRVSLDRLKLLALLDRNLTLRETVLSAALGSLVGVLGASLLHAGHYRDLPALILCFVMAGCQYSLLKSVQPDAASPTHGFNRVIAYSRPVYFCVFSSLALALDSSRDVSPMAVVARDFLLAFVLVFPCLFSLGLFPQIDTFVMYLLEQIDMHVFGGNAASSLSASLFCVLRSLLCVAALTGLAYGGLSESTGAQHVLFSMFCACLVASSYHLSRCSSDPSPLWNVVKRHLWLPDVYREQRAASEGGGEWDDRRGGAEREGGKVTEAQQRKPPPKPAPKSVKFDAPPPTPAAPAAPTAADDDPMPRRLQRTFDARLRHDAIACAVIAVATFALHASTVFSALRPELGPVLWAAGAAVGCLLHYVVPQMRKQLPWLCVARPILRAREHEQYQVRGPAKVMWFEKFYVYLCFMERNVLYPLLFLSALTDDSPRIAKKHGPVLGAILVVVSGLKCLRCSYSDQSVQYLVLTFTALCFKYDCAGSMDTFLLGYFLMSIVHHKVSELLLKLQFVVTYIAPWQITWGSAFHAFAQPFSVPHSAMLFLQAAVSAVLSTPLNPFLGSAIFITSYVRPVKFWERDYNTRRVDHSNTPLASHLDRNLGADDNNLNSLFYEHLTGSLQRSLCGDLRMGRWGPVSQGDCFVLASDYLNCLVHVIEMGNDLVTFQMRGLEFRGTYCQQREVEAITEGVEENDGCCCCDTGHIPNMLSINAAFSQRWLAWEVTAAKYILEGYSISDNSAVSMLQVFEFRKVLVSYYVKSIIFYLIRSPKLEEWLANKSILKALQPMEHRHFVDLDPVFNYNIDEDYDMQNSGMTKSMFIQIHGEWITYCVERSEKSIDSGNNSDLILFCFALSLLGRRTLGAVSHNTLSGVEFFLYGLHALFKGDFRISCARDEWVFTDMDLLHSVVAPGVRMSLKLHQDHFMSPDEYEELPALYEAICKHEEELVISHEGDPAWRRGVLSGTASLLALRHVLDEGKEEYKIIMLNKRFLSFRVIKINKECVRGLWAGQQQELVYLRNRNPERGSIQNAKQALRNIINSSCDQPIGYPIYVSPLTTSYAETNEQFCSLVGGSISLNKIRNYVLNLFRRIRKRCGEGCSSGSANREEICMGHEGIYAMTPISTLVHHTGSQSTDGSHLGGSIGRGSSLSRTSLGGNRGSLVSMGKPTSSTLVSLAGLFKEKDDRAISQAPDAQARADERLGDVNGVAEKEYVTTRVRIVDPNLVYDAINLGRRIDVQWPTEYMRIRGGRSYWKDWVPEAGMEGPVVHKWIPCHKDPSKRSHVDRTILLVQIDDRFVPVAESGVQDLGPEV